MTHLNMNAKLYSIGISLFLHHFSFGQTINNYGANVYVTSGTLVFMDAHYLSQTNGAIENSGQVELVGDFTNNANNLGFVNNAPGRVNLVGADQIITGSSPTHFYDLSLEGGASTKALQQNIRVTNSLNLNDAEFSLHNSIAHLSNPQVNALSWNTGYIYADSIGGYFARSTNSPQSYLIPLGTPNFSNRYRAIELQPLSNDSTVFACRLADVDASTDITGTSYTGATGAYNRNQTDDIINHVNAFFYHHITRFFGTANANYKILYYSDDNPIDYNAYNYVAYWNKQSQQWEHDSVKIESISGYTTVGEPNTAAAGTLMLLKDDPIALASKSYFEVYIPNAFTPNSNNLNDLFKPSSLADILSYEMRIFNRWGEEIFVSDSIDKGWSGDGHPNGVYTYKIKLQMNYKKQAKFFDYNGAVNLIR